jgi:hypothetical protein
MRYTTTDRPLRAPLTLIRADFGASPHCRIVLAMALSSHCGRCHRAAQSCTNTSRWLLMAYSNGWTSPGTISSVDVLISIYPHYTQPHWVSECGPPRWDDKARVQSDPCPQRFRRSAGFSAEVVFSLRVGEFEDVEPLVYLVVPPCLAHLSQVGMKPSDGLSAS